ncbi:hypothetical protein SELMODRAFT_420716 [Selaginella moellendorffii]|uniref:Uncharacterized protein n=1 Tax=Selaginella moellendorffii TaxID=88036 RepID=D8SCW1_SELML|nr:hypothetical protein SELMODRAFT_420716 [Selaginella moellendorffii]
MRHYITALSALPIYAAINSPKVSSLKRGFLSGTKGLRTASKLGEKKKAADIRAPPELLGAPHSYIFHCSSPATPRQLERWKGKELKEIVTFSSKAGDPRKGIDVNRTGGDGDVKLWPITRRSFSICRTYCCLKLDWVLLAFVIPPLPLMDDLGGRRVPLALVILPLSLMDDLGGSKGHDGGSSSFCAKGFGASLAEDTPVAALAGCLAAYLAAQALSAQAMAAWGAVEATTQPNHPSVGVARSQEPKRHCYQACHVPYSQHCH